ncbi:hypothetical protein JST97_11485 [bacterium]|nr:hypothetical protein [bacterium]
MKRMLIGALLAILLGGLGWLGRGVLAGPGPKSPQALVEGLSGSDAVNCFAELRQNEDDTVTSAIVAGTKHPRSRVRAQCARLLGERQDVALVPVLTPMLADSDASVSNNAAKALLPLLDDEELLALLRDARLTPASQLVMASTLLRDQSMLANKAFLDWLLDRTHSPEIRAGAYDAIRLRHLSCYGEKKLEKENLAAVLEGRQRISQQARQDGLDVNCEEGVRCSALIVYGKLGGNQAYPELVKLLKSSTGTLREASLVAVVATQDPRSVALLSAMVKNSQEPDQVRAVALLGLRALVLDGLEDKSICPLVCQLAQDTGQPPQLRATAMGSLRAFRFNSRALQIARQGLTDKDPLIRMRAAQSVAGLGDKNARLGETNCLEPSLAQLKLALACESKPEARCALESAVRTLEGRMASRGK